MQRLFAASDQRRRQRLFCNAAGWLVVASSLMIGLRPDTALAQSAGQRDADWPCQQIKVPTLSLAAVWSGPAIDLNDPGWKNNETASALAESVTPRRVPIAAAEAAIHSFAQQEGGSKTPALLAAMAGIFSTLNQEHASVIAGLDRFGGRQRELATQIREENEKLSALQTGPSADPKAAEALAQRVTWDAQVFEDRRQALSYACDVPPKIEQRLFALARAIQQELE